MSKRQSAMHKLLDGARGPLLAAAILALALPMAAQQVFAQQGEGRGGKQVVEATCASCHAKGVDGAPRIGDAKAWAPRAKQGLTSLTQEALNGIRKMPAHGGKLTLTDLEIGRAVTYMVNQSGGKWVEPASPKAMAAERTGKQVVEAQCIKCHDKGDGGAPKIGDQAAWAPRISQGLDSTVRSAVQGHGGMPERGGMASATDTELRNAILYMFNRASAAKK